MSALDLLLGAAPSVLLLIFFYVKDRFEPEPHGHVLAAFLLGFVAFGMSYAGAVGLEAAVGRVWLALGGWQAHLFEAGVVAAGVEEAAKWILLFAVIVRWKEFDEPLDGIVYGVALALGLATVENVLYVRNAGLEVGLLRAVLSVPAHALYGAVMGFGFGRAKLGRGRNSTEPMGPSGKRRALLGAFLVPVAFHTLFDFALIQLRGPWMYVAVVALSVVLWWLVLRQVRALQDDSPFQSTR